MPKDFSFNNDDRFKQVDTTKKVSQGFPALLIKWGVVKNERQANALLIFIIVAGFAFIVYLNMKTFSPPPAVVEDPSFIEEIN